MTEISIEDIRKRPGIFVGGTNDLNFIISMKTNNPVYAGNTKRVLADNNVRVSVKNGIIECLDKILAFDRSFFDSSSIIRMAAFMHVFKSSLKRNNPNVNFDY